MKPYLIRRILTTIPILFAISILVFSMAHLVPGDPVKIMLGMRASAERVELVREQLGLNDPIPKQYARFISNAFQGDFGRSIRSGRKVFSEIIDRFPATVELTVFGLVLAIFMGIVAGTLSATAKSPQTDLAIMIGAMISVSVPGFWFGLLLILLFCIKWPLFPIAGAGGLAYLVLPAVTLGLRAAAIIARVTRASILEVLRQNYIQAARAKGLPERLVIYKHALRNGLIPVITIVGLQFGGLLSGAFIIEFLFARPGIGMLAVNALKQRDFPVIQGVVLFAATIYVLVNLVVDIINAFIDPRVQYQ
jgi:ABC-type dipeptide/oligopeptide/nickel transport system permease component